MNNQYLIPVFNGKLSDSSETLLCDARKLHEFLQISANSGFFYACHKTKIGI